MHFEWNSCFSILSSQTLEIVYCPSYILTNKKNLSGFLVSHNAPFHTTITMLLHNTFSTNCLKYFFLYSFICIFSFSFFFSVFCMYCFPYSYFIFYLFSPDIFWYLFLQTVPCIDHEPFVWPVFNFFQTMSTSFFLAFLFVSFMIPLLFSYSLWHMICHHYNNFL